MCSPAELPTPLKKRRLTQLDCCLSESSTPYGSPCATPTRFDQSEPCLTPSLLATPPRPRTEETTVEILPRTPTQALVTPQEVCPLTPRPHAPAYSLPQPPCDWSVCSQSESSVESSPEAVRRPSTQEVRRPSSSSSWFAVGRSVGSSHWVYVPV